MTQYLPTVTSIVTLLGVIFMAYRGITLPQQKSQVEDARFAEQIKTTLETVARLQLDLTNLRDNHVHTLDLKMDTTNKGMQDLAIKVAELSTIINERIPKKT